MILSKLKLKNFKKYKFYEVNFELGLVGILGKNGSGKSTIFEAILFALYGELKNKGYKEIIRNAEASTKDIVLVELNFEFENIEYKVIREFRGKALSANAKLYKNGILITSGAKEVTISVVRLTKMSKNAFLHTLFASQKELTNLSSLKNEDRKKMIRKLLGLEKIDFIENLLTEKNRQLKREIDAFAEVLLSDDEIKLKQSQIKEKRIVKEDLKKEIISKLKELEIIKSKEFDIKKELNILQKTKEKKQKLVNEQKLLKNSIDSKTLNRTKLSLELKELEVKKTELKTLENIKEDYQSLYELLKEQDKLKEYNFKKEGLLKEQTQYQVQYKKSKKDIKILEKECEKYDDFIFKAKNLEQNISILQDTIVDKQTIEKEIRAQIAGEQKLIDETSKKIANIQKLGTESACPTCTRPLLEEYDNVINSLNTTVQNTHKIKIYEYKMQLIKVEQQKNEFEIKKRQKDKKLLVIAKTINLIKSKKKDLKIAQEYFKTIEQKGLKNSNELKELEIYSYSQNNHKNIQNKFDKLKLKYEYILQLETLLKRLPSIKVDLTNTIKNLEKLNQQYKIIEKDIKKIKYDEVIYWQKQNEYDEIQKLKEMQINTLNEIKIKVAKIEGGMKILQNSIANNDIQFKKVQVKKNDILDYEKIKIFLGIFKTKINSKVAPRISDIASNMFSKITKGKYQLIEVNNDFDFYIYDDGKKYPIERFSGGEVDLANLVLRIAISKTLGELSGARSIEFLAFDEVFGSQDETRRHEILEVFHMIKEQYRQIFLISHEIEIKEMFEWVMEL